MVEVGLYQQRLRFGRRVHESRLNQPHAEDRVRLAFSLPRGGGDADEGKWRDVQSALLDQYQVAMVNERIQIQGSVSDQSDDVCFGIIRVITIAVDGDNRIASANS